MALLAAIVEWSLRNFERLKNRLAAMAKAA